MATSLHALEASRRTVDVCEQGLSYANFAYVLSAYEAQTWSRNACTLWSLEVWTITVGQLLKCYLDTFIPDLPDTCSWSMSWCNANEKCTNALCACTCKRYHIHFMCGSSLPTRLALIWMWRLQLALSHQHCLAHSRYYVSPTWLPRPRLVHSLLLCRTVQWLHTFVLLLTTLLTGMSRIEHEHEDLDYCIHSVLMLPTRVIEYWCKLKRSFCRLLDHGRRELEEPRMLMFRHAAEDFVV